MAMHYIWWVLAVALGIAELATGSFYMLVLAAGAVAAGFAAVLGFGLAAQFICAAVVSAGGAVLVRRLHGRDVAAHRNPDVNLDIGQPVEVVQWNADGRSRVSYRGALWDAELMPGEPAVPGRFLIREVDGNRLRLARAGAPPAANA
jgi:membrane protein implicated in regulation of membrane protease activity